MMASPKINLNLSNSNTNMTLLTYLDRVLEDVVQTGTDKDRDHPDDSRFHSNPNDVTRKEVRVLEITVESQNKGSNKSAESNTTTVRAEKAAAHRSLTSSKVDDREPPIDNHPAKKSAVKLPENESTKRIPKKQLSRSPPRSRRDMDRPKESPLVSPRGRASVCSGGRPKDSSSADSRYSNPSETCRARSKDSTRSSKGWTQPPTRFIANKGAFKAEENNMVGKRLFIIGSVRIDRMRRLFTRGAGRANYTLGKAEPHWHVVYAPTTTTKPGEGLLSILAGWLLDHLIDEHDAVVIDLLPLVTVEDGKKSDPILEAGHFAYPRAAEVRAQGDLDLVLNFIQFLSGMVPKTPILILPPHTPFLKSKCCSSHMKTWSERDWCLSFWKQLMTQDERINCRLVMLSQASYIDYESVEMEYDKSREPGCSPESRMQVWKQLSTEGNYNVTTEAGKLFVHIIFKKLGIEISEDISDGSNQNKQNQRRDGSSGGGGRAKDGRDRRGDDWMRDRDAGRGGGGHQYGGAPQRGHSYYYRGRGQWRGYRNY